jgi:hypothetical protein
MGANDRKRSNEGEGFDPQGEWTVGDVLRAMTGGDIPPYIERLASQIQEWMISALSGEGELSTEDYLFGFGDRKQGDPEVLISQLEWVDEFADILPASNEPAGHEEAVALCFGQVDFDEGMRMAIDYAALFGRDHCRRVWMLSDSWIIGEVVRYVQHFRALASHGVELRFVMVTPWGWTEIPIALETGDNDRLHWEARMARQDHNNNSLKPKKRDDPNQK